MTYHNKSIEQVSTSFSTSSKFGLTTKQAKQRLSNGNLNQLQQIKKVSLASRFLQQFKDIMVLILIVSAIISFVVACISTDKGDYLESIIIIGIVVLNATLGVVQEYKAEKALEALTKLTSPTARVIRDAVELTIEATQLVVGDLIVLSAGDIVSADARLVSSNALKCDESALTGESVTVDKDAAKILQADTTLGSQTNMIFSGSFVTAGNLTAIVTATGMNTEIGKIAHLITREEASKTPLQQRLANMGKNLGYIALAISFVIFIVGVISRIDALEIFITSVSLAVAAIPEGLPAVVTIVLAIGVRQMVSQNAIIRKLPAVETLGSASVICSDKTGTLTQNKMSVRQVFDGSALMSIGKAPSKDCLKLLCFAMICNDSRYDKSGNLQGDATEKALVMAAEKHNLKLVEAHRQYERVAEVPFSSARKLMTTVHKIDGKYLVVTKGAFDYIEDKCRLVGEQKVLFNNVNNTMSNNALRVIAVGYKYIDSLPATVDERLESELQLLGLVGMIDPPRAEASGAVAMCKKAGIKPIMITGDHVKTAIAIAKQIGILDEGDLALTGEQLSKMTDEQLYADIDICSVYARVTPQDKIRIVKALQRQGKVVAMTGDGVNDAPALKAADIGCAFGQNGTEVAKGAADMVLLDDNFNTIVSAVKVGRGIYDNIKKAVQFLLGSNVGEVVTVFVAMFIFHRSPLNAMQLLWINLVTDCLPALALGMEKIDDDIMTRKPLKKQQSIFSDGMGLRVIIHGAMIGGLALFAYYIGLRWTNDVKAASTLTFIVLAMSQLFYCFTVRSEKSLFNIGAFSNMYLIGAFASSVALMALVVFTPMSQAFGLARLELKHYVVALDISLMPLIILEIVKSIKSVTAKLRLRGKKIEKVKLKTNN